MNMIRTLSIGILGIISALPSPPPASLELRASLSARTLTVFEGGQQTASYSIAVGSARHPTPTGSFFIRKLIWNPGWVPPDADWARNKTAKAPGSKNNPMRAVKIFFKEPDYYIHGTDDTESLGAPDSHGCLRMDPEQVTELGKMIMAAGGQPREESWFWRVLHYFRDEKPVYLDNPVPLTITE
jgi:murein L,D-transpeptidase YcbB/YkuD